MKGVILLVFVFAAAQSGQSPKRLSCEEVRRCDDIPKNYEPGRGELLRTIGYRDFAYMKRLLCLGVDIDYRSKSGSTALMWAASAGDLELTEFLLCFTPDVNARDEDGRTALFHVMEGICSCGEAASGEEQVLRLLLDAGAEVNGTDKNGQTPLFRAYRHPPLLRLLLGRGAETNIRDREGTSVLSLALREEVVSRSRLASPSEDLSPEDIAALETDLSRLLEGISLLKQAGAGE
jgi:ankyrin repeat protein